MSGIMTSARRGRKLSKANKEWSDFDDCRFSPIGHKKTSKDIYQGASGNDSKNKGEEMP
jgi:hypothetical protein